MNLEAKIRQHSDAAFAKHVITQDLNQGLYRSWTCKRPGESQYWFRITTIPGTLILTGDRGSLVVTRENDMVAWCRRAVNSTHYFAEKCQDTKSRVFSHEAVTEWIAEQRALLTEQADEYEPDSIQIQHEQLDEVERRLDELDWRGVYEIAQDCFDPGEPPSWDDWDSQFLWRRDAIRWFVNHADGT